MDSGKTPCKPLPHAFKLQTDSEKKRNPSHLFLRCWPELATCSHDAVNALFQGTAYADREFPHIPDYINELPLVTKLNCAAERETWWRFILVDCKLRHGGRAQQQWQAWLRVSF
jgi:hypothetical protein